MPMRLQQGFLPPTRNQWQYERGRRNLTELYLPLCDRWIIYDNSQERPTVVAQRGEDGQPSIFSLEVWNQITEV